MWLKHWIFAIGYVSGQPSAQPIHCMMWTEHTHCAVVSWTWLWEFVKFERYYMLSSKFYIFFFRRYGVSRSEKDEKVCLHFLFLLAPFDALLQSIWMTLAWFFLLNLSVHASPSFPMMTTKWASFLFGVLMWHTIQSLGFVYCTDNSVYFFILLKVFFYSVCGEVKGSGIIILQSHPSDTTVL